MLTNISYLFLITLILIVGGWGFKALIALAQGNPVELNFKNPLNLTFINECLFRKGLFYKS